MPKEIKSVVSPRLLNRLTAYGGEEMMPLVEDILKEAWKAGYDAGAAANPAPAPTPDPEPEP